MHQLELHPDRHGLTCIHTPGNNLFGCNTHGTMALKQINGIAPTTGTGANTVINSSFPATFQRRLRGGSLRPGHH